MKKIKMLTALLVCGFMTQTLAASAEKDTLESKTFFNKVGDRYDLVFRPGDEDTPVTAEVNGKTITYRAYERIVYVQNPVEPEYQTVNIYIPNEYYTGSEVNGYNSENAPIFLPNSVGGYMPAKAAVATQRGMGGRESTILSALSKGYVVASVGARGRTLQQGEIYTGKAPAVIVDLKAAVKYLRFNDERMPGDANKIISNGTSAGGAMSALLALSGDKEEYNVYLKELGAANASDAIFAASVYCPITNLEHADAAYEWQFNGLNEYSRMDMSKLTASGFNDRSRAMSTIEGSLTLKERMLSLQLKEQFISYLNSLRLSNEKGEKLTLDKNGDGPFKEYIKSYLVESANKAIEEGEDLSETQWATISNGKVVDVNWRGFIHSKKRMKSPPAFDALDLSSGENDLFGTKTVKAKHFTQFSADRGTNKDMVADREIVKMMNAMNYVENKHGAKHLRIRVGSADYDTSHAISAMLVSRLEMEGREVDYAIPWGVPHSGDYDLEELFRWIDSIAK